MVKNILQSELLKFFSYNWCLYGMIGTILIAPLLLLFSGNNQGMLSTTLLSICLRNLFLSQAGLVLISASFFGQEYSNSYLRTTLVTIPSRIRFILSKFLILTIVVWSIALLSGIICLGVGTIQFGSPLTVSLLLGFLLKALPAILSWTLIAWITAFLTILSQSQIIPIALMFSLILGLSQLFLALTPYAKFLPDLATMNLFFTTSTMTFLPANQGLFVQLSWTLFLGIIAIKLLINRDVR